MDIDSLIQEYESKIAELEARNSELEAELGDMQTWAYRIYGNIDRLEDMATDLRLELQRKLEK